MLNNEDPERKWAISLDLCSEGKQGPCFAISGINSGDFPEDFAAIQNTPQAERGPLVEEFYQSKFWSPMKIEGIESQDIANRVLDEGVWSGAGTAIRLLQRACNDVYSGPENGLTCDGILGPESLAAVSEASEGDLLAAYREERWAYLQILPMYRNAAPRQQAAYKTRAMA